MCKVFFNLLEMLLIKHRIFSGLNYYWFHLNTQYNSITKIYICSKHNKQNTAGNKITTHPMGDSDLLLQYHVTATYFWNHCLI